MDNEFLHRINIEALKKELDLDVSSIAKLAGISENGVYKWAWPKESNGARPSFNAIIKLLNAGASVETLFGVNYKPQLPETAIVPSQDFLDNPSVKEGLDNAFEAFLIKKGLIKKSEG